MRIYDGAGTRTKEYFVKIFDTSGNMLTSSFDIGFSSFKKSINGGLGELTLELARKFDDFGEGVEIDFMNEVQIWVVDKESGPEGIKIYSGFIDQYEPFATGTGEGVIVRCLGYATRLADIIYRVETAISIAHASVDPTTIAEAIIDAANTILAQDIFSYDTTTIEDTGTSCSYTFNMKTCYEALGIVRELAPANWWWYVDEDGYFYFKEKQSTPTHTFTFSGDIADIRVLKNIRDVKNQIIVWNGLMDEDSQLLCRSYRDLDSRKAYGNRMEAVTDGRLLVQATMDQYGESFINTRKDPNVRVTLTVIDSNLNDFGYDIELINPGDTCRIKNLPETSTTFDENMVITDVVYQLGKVQITLEDLRQKLTAKFSDVIKELKTHVYTDGPATFTTV